MITKSQLLKASKLYLLYGMFITIVFARLNLNSLFLILFAFVWLVEGKLKDKWELLKKDTLFIAYALYFLIQLLGLVQSINIYSGLDKVENKMGFLLLPMVFCSTPFLDIAMRRKIMLVLGLAVTSAAIYCLVMVSIQYYHTGNSDLFFYHQLVSPLSHHAVYFSVYTFIILAFLVLEAGAIPWLKKNRVIRIGWIIFLLVFLFLLSSKMVLLVVILFLFYLFFRFANKKIARRQAIAAGLLAIMLIVAIVSTDNPVHKRFIDLRGNMELLHREKYDAGIYFNGWEFRVLLWRVTYEIIKDKHAWLVGVGPADAQAILDEKYLELGLYSGDKNSDGRGGYLQYNCHNQFLQTMLQSGITGLLFLLGWCIMLFKRMLPLKEPVLLWSLVIIICFFFIESVCERQYGMILCTLIPLMYLYTYKKEVSH